jgi:uncharacterized repeat protein (TIGR01451 family)
VAQDRSVDIPVVNGVQTPVLTLDKRGPATIRLGQQLAYEIVVRNGGAIVAQRVRIEDELPPGTRMLRTDPPAAMQADRLIWILDNLPSGAEKHLRVEVQPAAGGDWSSTATASIILSTSSSLRTRVVAASLSLTMSGPETVGVGQTAAFQIRVTNNGTQPLTGLVLRDRVPRGLQHSAGGELEADLGTLEPGKTRNINLTTKAIEPGRQINEALVTAADGQQAEAQAAVNVLSAPRSSR